jgi:hypothetical protein
MYIGQNNSWYYANVLGGNCYFGYTSSYSCKPTNKILTDLDRQLTAAFESGDKKISFIF